MKPSVSVVKRSHVFKKKSTKEIRPWSSYHLCLIVVICWLFVLCYFWKTGTNIPTITYVDEVMKNAKVTLKGSVTNSPPMVQSDGPDTSDIHVVFSTDCGEFQDWQTLLLFHSAMIVGQQSVTRIASGCDETKKKVLFQLYRELHPQYHVHFTPDFSRDEKSQRSCKQPCCTPHRPDFFKLKVSAHHRTTSIKIIFS